jgi:protein-tyrosine kinase
MTEHALLERPAIRANGDGRAAIDSALSAHYGALVQRIRAIALDTDAAQAIGITSCARGAGVSTVAFNVAAAAAEAGLGPVLLVGTDVADAVGRHAGEASPVVGLADALDDGSDPMDCVISSAIEELSVVATRGSATRGTPALDPIRIAEILNVYKCHFKLVIVDIPPPTEFDGSICLAGQMDGVVLVIEAERVDSRVALKMKRQLDAANANVLGVVFNKRREYVPNWLYGLL